MKLDSYNVRSTIRAALQDNADLSVRILELETQNQTLRSALNYAAGEMRYWLRCPAAPEARADSVQTVLDRTDAALKED